MTVLAVQTRFGSASGFSEDDQVNTMHFEGDVGGDLDNVADMIEDFYNANGGSGTIASQLAVSAINGFNETRIYNLEDPIPRPPVYIRSWELVGVTAGTTQAAEVSCCVSFAAAPQSGVARGRLRNRIYLPTIRSSVIESSGLFSSAFMQNIADNANALRLAAEASLDYRWGVYSPTRAAQGSAPIDGFADVTHGWVDNAPDIQRRRGITSTARTAWPAP